LQNPLEKKGVVAAD